MVENGRNDVLNGWCRWCGGFCRGLLTVSKVGSGIMCGASTEGVEFSLADGACGRGLGIKGLVDFSCVGFEAGRISLFLVAYRAR